MPADERDRLVIALDLATAVDAFALVDRLGAECRWCKVGMELFYRAGRPFVETLAARGYKIFLDLKLHDIPNTVAAAVRSVSDLGVSLLTVHASGGEAMLAAAAESAGVAGAPMLLAVTVLTSMDRAELGKTGIQEAPAAQVLRLARLAGDTGIRGLVCSAQELGLLREQLGPEPLLVVPGIRPADSAAGDQRRVATPAAALQGGASMLVVGRPITAAPDPLAACRAILAEMASGAGPG